MINTDKCFKCGNIISTDICPHCGYSFSLPYTCPRRINDSIICAHTRKMCREGNKWEQCGILRSNN